MRKELIVNERVFGCIGPLSLVSSGAYGKVFLLKIGQNKHVAIKSDKWDDHKMSSARQQLSDASDIPWGTTLQNRAKHKSLFRKLSPPCKKFFVTPLNIKDYCMRDTGQLHAMEYVEGKTLNSWLDGPTLPSERLHVISQIQRALFCMWKAGYIHGDLHLNNVLVTKKNKVKIIDFGFLTKVDPLPKTTTHGNKDKIAKWFVSQFPKVLKSAEITKGNPDITLYGLKALPMFASSHETKIYRRLFIVTNQKPASVKV